MLKAKTKKNKVKFYAYKTKKYENKLIDLFEKNNIKNIILPFKNFINKNYGGFIPYSLIYKNSNLKISIDKNQYVRNIATILDILNLDLLDINLDAKVLKIIKKKSISLY